jgi:hypothetical protein
MGKEEKREILAEGGYNHPCALNFPPTKREEDAISGAEDYDLKYSIRDRAIFHLAFNLCDLLFGNNKFEGAHG